MRANRRVQAYAHIEMIEHASKGFCIHAACVEELLGQQSLLKIAAAIQQKICHGPGLIRSEFLNFCLGVQSRAVPTICFF